MKTCITSYVSYNLTICYYSKYYIQDKLSDKIHVLLILYCIINNPNIFMYTIINIHDPWMQR